jgi:hypothetical protein
MELLYNTSQRKAIGSLKYILIERLYVISNEQLQYIRRINMSDVHRSFSTQTYNNQI